MQKAEELLVDIEGSDLLVGTITDHVITSTLSLKRGDIDMEFTLPRCRAGPLVVPFINY